MKIKKIVAGMVASVMAASMMSVHVNASTPNGWELKRYAYQPSNSGSWSYSDTVSGLVDGVDSAIDFNCGYFSGGDSNTYVKCDIQANMKKYSSEYAYIYSFGDSGSVRFRNNWYQYSNGGNCNYTVYLMGYNGVNGVTIRGYAS